MSIFSKMVSSYKRLLDEGQKSEWATAEITEYGIFNVPEDLKESARKKVEAFEASISTKREDDSIKTISSLLALSKLEINDYYVDEDGHYHTSQW
ncbi:hypothetical protein B0187_00905 [Haemophilus paracuniculus]|uniref:Uncharacterized protein n=1 Tax=Haemophilus paracuniculus TaxID=734 RepID=A0A1T0AVH2_9PAST|nr:hypothetical protein [Haemophilus paracuniculus]OOS00884.1 hypothetical protein B0187_00905 [Haemophilus paracuniculus]